KDGPGQLFFGFQPRDYPPATNSPTGVSSRDQVDLWAGTVTRVPLTGAKTSLAVYSPTPVDAEYSSLNLTVVDFDGLPFYNASRFLTEQDTGTGGLLSALPLFNMPADTDIQVLNGNEMSLILEVPDEPFLMKADFVTAQTDWLSTKNGSGSPEYE